MLRCIKVWLWIWVEVLAVLAIPVYVTLLKAQQELPLMTGSVSSLIICTVAISTSVYS